MPYCSKADPCTPVFVLVLVLVLVLEDAVDAVSGQVGNSMSYGISLSRLRKRRRCHSPVVEVRSFAALKVAGELSRSDVISSGMRSSVPFPALFFFLVNVFVLSSLLLTFPAQRLREAFLVRATGTNKASNTNVCTVSRLVP